MAKFRRITALVLVIIMSISLLGINVLASDAEPPVADETGYTCPTCGAVLPAPGDGEHYECTLVPAHITDVLTCTQTAHDHSSDCNNCTAQHEHNDNCNVAVSCAHTQHSTKCCDKSSHHNAFTGKHFDYVISDCNCTHECTEANGCVTADMLCTNLHHTADCILECTIPTHTHDVDPASEVCCYEVVAATHTHELKTTPQLPEQTVYVYVQPDDNTGNQGTNNSGYYTVGTITLRLPAPSSEYAGQNDTSKQRCKDYAGQIATAGINQEYNDWIKTSEVQWYTLHCSSGADNYVTGGNYTWHLDGSIVKAPTLYSVTYKANDGTDAYVNDPSSYETGTEVTTLVNAFTAPDGMHFVNWNTQADGKGTGYAVGDTFSITANVTLYAIWAENPATYTTSYSWTDANGNAMPADFSEKLPNSESGLASEEIAKAAAANHPFAPVTTDAGTWTFSGWTAGAADENHNVAFTGTWTFEAATYELSVNKVVAFSEGSATVDVPTSFTFNVYAAADAAKELSLGTITANKGEGNAYTSDKTLKLAAGNYILEEANGTIPAGYALTTTGTGAFTIGAAAQTVEVTNTCTQNFGEDTINPATLTITKVDSANADTKLPGAGFTVYSDNGCTTVAQAEQTTGETGTATFTFNAAGTYYLKETTAPEGYTAIDTVWEINVEKSGVIGVSGPTDGLFHNIYNWLVGIVGGNPAANAQTLTVKNSLIETSTFHVYVYDPLNPENPILVDTYDAIVNNGDTIHYNTKDKVFTQLTADEVNAIATEIRADKKYPVSARLKYADISELNKASTWDVTRLTVTDGNVVDAKGAIKRLIMHGGKANDGASIQTRLHLTWELPHSVTYVATGAPADWTVPTDPVQHYKGEKLTVATATAPAIPDGKQGTWSFDGWTTEDATVNDGKFTMPNKNVEFTGKWTFTEATKYSVTYEFDKAPGTTRDLPAAITAPATQTNKYYSGDTATPVTITDTSRVEVINGVTQGTWNFGSWTPDSQEVKSADVHFVGTWGFTEAGKVSLTYQFKAEDGSELPAGVTGLKPANVENQLPGTIVTIEDLTSKSFDVKLPTNSEVITGTWTFVAWDTTDKTVTLDESKTVTGTWKYEAAEQYKIFYRIDGTFTEETIKYETQNLYENEIIALHTAISHPGYTFSGWKLENYTAPEAETRAMAAGADDKSFEGKTMPAHDLIAVGSYTYNPPYIPDVPTPTPTPTPTPPVETIDPGEVPLVPGPEETIDPDGTPLDPSPKTGDNADIALLWLVFCASFCGLVVIGVTAPKKRNDR